MASNFPLTSANIGQLSALLQITAQSKQARFLFTGTYTGVTGTIQASYTGIAGSFVTLANIREDTGATYNGTVGSAQFSTICNVGNWTYLLFNLTAIASGTVNVTIDNGANFTLPLGIQPIALASVSQVITSSAAGAFVVGPNGSTNPAFNVDASAGSAATGWNIAAAAAAGGAALKVISSGSAENGTIDAKGTGTLSLQTVATGAITLGAATGVTGALTGTSTSASALAVGANGATNPVLKINANTASVASGLEIIGAASGSGVAVNAIGGTNELLALNGKGNAGVTIAAAGTGPLVIGSGTNGPTVLKGTLTGGGLLTCALQVATSGPLVYSGSGVPTISAAVQGSIYLRSDGSSTSTRLYVATNNSGTWASCTTSA